MEIDFPFYIDRGGQTATTDEGDHLRDLIEQVLFTTPGERVNRPDFGSGLLQLVFAPNSDELAATLQFTVQASLQQWLGDRLEVGAVEVSNVDATLRVVVRYRPLRSAEERVAEFTRSAG
jgi:phage baseplate assembly protein W